MKIVFTTLLLFVFSIATAQDDDVKEIPYVHLLALDKSPKEADQFNREIGKGAVDYNLAFIDTENSPTIRYVYKTSANETLRLDYKYDIVSSEDGKRSKRVVIFQRISGNLQVIAAIYNHLFNSNISPATIMTVATTGSPVAHQGKIYHFTFQPDDYNPGYWVLSFIK